MNPKVKATPKGAAGKKKGSKQSPAKRFIFTVIKTLIIFIIALSCAIAGIVGGAMYGYIKTAQPIRDEDLQIKILTSFIYDKDGKEIAQLTGKDNKNRELVTYDEIPDYLKNAYISVEDERFLTHNGVDVKGILNMVYSLVSSGGSGGRGGSTITQQVVKNITGNTKLTLQRKVQEWYSAITLEKKLHKWQILELYMNIIFMGNEYYGVQSASKAYFGCDVKDLSLAQCALLAGITQLPGKYNPFTESGRKNAKVRQELILKLMLEQKMIDQKQYEQALAEDLKYAERSENSKNVSSQTYFVDQAVNDVKKDLMESKGYTESMALTMIYSYGLKIYTTQDSDAQKAMDEVYNDEKYFIGVEPKTKKLLERPESGMVVIDPETGEVKALRGGFGKKSASMTLNRATQIKRQPGSSIKPIAVYAPAIDLQKITAATVIDDSPVYMDSRKKDTLYPNNFDHTYNGLTTIRNAIKASVNVVAAKVWMNILGPDQSLEYLKKVGINRDKERYVSLALGGLNEGVSPLEMAAAYVPFVHKGMYFKPSTYTKVLDNSGKTLLENKPEPSIVYNETTAFLMVSMMTDVINSPGGTAYGGGIIKNAKGQVITTAGKTGTTSKNRDKWFVGYSPYYVAATWYGYDVERDLVGAESRQALIIWHDVMEKIHKDKKPIPFTKPSGLVTKQICIYSGKVPSLLCANDPRGSAVRDEYFVKGTEPKDNEPCDIHILANICLDSKDVWGKNLLAGAYCPITSVMEKVFIQRKVPYVPTVVGEDPPLDWKLYELPAGEYCPIHGTSPEGTLDSEGTTDSGRNTTSDGTNSSNENIDGNANESANTDTSQTQDAGN